MSLCRLGFARELLAVVVAVVVGAVVAPQPCLVVVVVVLVGIGPSAVGVDWRRARGSVARSTTAAVASSSMEGKVALARMVAAVEVLLAMLASVLGLALVLVPVPMPVLGFGAAFAVTVAAGVRSRSLSLRPVGASVPRSPSLCAWRALRCRCPQKVAPLRLASMMTSVSLMSF